MRIIWAGLHPVVKTASEVGALRRSDAQRGVPLAALKAI
jgi:hypothetical protein